MCHQVLYTGELLYCSDEIALADFKEKVFKIYGDYGLVLKYFDSAKYNLQTAIEAMIDIGNHIISRKGFEIPKTYADTFEILHKNGIIEKKRRRHL